MTRAAIYCRVSSEEQAAEGKTSIDTQRDDCRALAAKLGWIVAGEFVDDKRYRVGKKLVEPSGTRADRPQWRKMLAALSDGRADALIAWHSSRLYRAYRPMIDLLDIMDERPGIRIELVKEQFNKDTAILYAWVGRKENEARNERVRFGMAGRAKKGLPPSSHSSFFKPIIEPATGEKLGYEFDESYRAHFDRLARLFVEGHPYHAIARLLGTNPVTGKRWSQPTVRHILQNPYYRGRLDYGRSAGPVRFSVTTQHRAVWDTGTVRSIEAEIERRRRYKGPRSTTILFSGILHCGYCGHQMSGATIKAKGQPYGRPYRAYTCQWPTRARRGDPLAAQYIDHPPNWISEHKLLRLLRDEIHQLDGLDFEDVLSLVAAAAPQAVTTGGADARELADLESQIAEMEPEVARVRSAAAKAALDGELSRLRAEAEVYRAHLSAVLPASMIDFDRLREGWGELLATPEPFEIPDAELRQLLTKSFAIVFVAAGQIVPSPADR